MRGIRLASALALVWGMSGCDVFLANRPPGDLVVTVTDGTGAPVAGVRIYVALDGAPASRAFAGDGTTDDFGQAAFLNLDSNEYRVTIRDLPEELVFAVTEAVIFVPEEGQADQEFSALRDGTVIIRVHTPFIPLEGVLVSLVDQDGEIVALGRTGVPPEPRARITFPGLRRQMYEARVSDYPDWVEFERIAWPVDLLRYEESDQTLIGRANGGRKLEVRVTADGVGLEGVVVEYTYVGNVVFPRPRWLTDSEGVVRLDWWPSTHIWSISGFDETRYQFPITTRTVIVPHRPGLTVVEFKGTSAAGDAPIVEISTPQDGDRFGEGRTVVLSGGASDQQDGMLSESSLEWTSSLRGALGTGEELRWSSFAVGEHVITLTATDSDGNTAQASVLITIVANQGPSVAILTPADGAPLTEGDPIEFRGSASDPEDGSLFGAALVWTSDLDGPLATDEYFVTSELSVGTHVVTLAATDRGGVTVTASITIEIAPNAAPTVAITSPSEGASLTVGDLVTFIGSAVDPEDGVLSGASLIWTSDRDGTIGTGMTFSRADLSIGMHVVTLTATDRHGASASASVTVAVNTRPVVSISRPDISIYLFGEAVPFEGTAVDAEDGILSGASMVWTSSLDGVIGTGMSFSRSDLRVGSHVITLTATDSDGASSSVSKTLLIQGSGDATINGRVEVPGLGIAGVMVTATGPTTTSTITDANGDYTLTGLAPGTYTLSISNVPPWASFDTTSIVVTLAGGQTVSITFTGSGG